jgi:hypothetical protein
MLSITCNGLKEAPQQNSIFLQYLQRLGIKLKDEIDPYL